MSGWLHRVLVLFAVVCILANAGCYSQCLIASCGSLQSPRPSHDASGCHRGKPSIPGQERPDCSHQQMAAGFVDKVWQTTSVPPVFQIATYLPVTFGFDIAKSGSVASAGLSPPPFHFIA